MNGSGDILWDIDGIAICDDSSSQQTPQITADGSGGAIIVWPDYRNYDTNGYDIYMQGVDSSGKLYDNPTVISFDPYEKKPTEFHLHQNYPNPFNPKTTIEYQLLKSAKVELGIYTMTGKRVATLVSGKQAAGSYKIEWNASGFASGVYLYRLILKAPARTAATFEQTRKLILLK